MSYLISYFNIIERRSIKTMSNVAPIKIDVTNGKLPVKEKGLIFQEFANPAEERRNKYEI